MKQCLGIHSNCILCRSCLFAHSPFLLLFISTLLHTIVFLVTKKKVECVISMSLPVMSSFNHVRRFQRCDDTTTHIALHHLSLLQSKLFLPFSFFIYRNEYTGKTYVSRSLFLTLYTFPFKAY